ncbi:thiol:disulfide interchange protein tlpA [Pseudobdellovibrio exovorus JSS]|uniref:Thiol:disulfide interchange protein tlpA n=2 Tax=Pseudobdellovibrio exovorus TaxID=453816 RepID=M4VDJ3_9BACT|nr:thiol:disulfide interchange protein tlpA [Pseudobdellovibrio exovorus JSS]
MKLNMKLKITLVFVVLAIAFTYAVFKGNYFSFSFAPKRPVAVTEELSPEQLFDGLKAAVVRDYKGAPLLLADDLFMPQKPVVVHLWASWCGPCVNEVPELIEFAHKNPEVTFIVVSLDEESEDIAKFMKSFPEFDSNRFIRVWDKDNALAKFINADRLPMSAVVRSDRARVQMIKSVVDWNNFEL